MSSSPTSAVLDVTMPQMGVSVAEGTIIEWRKQPGDWIEADETICEISTDKIDTEVPSPASGRISEILVDPGTTVDVGTVLARIETDAKPGEPHVSEAGSEAAAARGETPAPATDTPSPAPARNGGNGHRRYSPVVQRIAAEHDVDLESVQGSGRGGRVRKQDVLAAVQAPAEAPMHIESPYRPDEPAPAASPGKAPAPPGEGLSRMRRSIGEHMKRSLETAATCTSWMEADMTRVEEARAKLGLTALPIVARAVIDALREFPSLNATLDGDDYTQHESVNLGIAVSLGKDGLIVPVIHDAQNLAPEGLGKRIRELARAARSKQLSPDDVRGGTFTITNPGQYGTLMATPVINQPQVAILDLEAVVKRPVVVEGDAIAVRAMTILGLSWDHRALDGVLAAQFLAAVRRRLEGFDG